MQAVRTAEWGIQSVISTTLTISETGPEKKQTIM
jgi:hypothetical protein